MCICVQDQNKQKVKENGYYFNQATENVCTFSVKHLLQAANRQIINALTNGGRKKI